jgi:hypothetical protein
VSTDDVTRDRHDSVRPVSWTNRLILGFAVLVGLVAGWFIATAFLPLWWAHRVGDVADRSTPTGIFAGLVCGLVFTVIPLVLLRVVVRRGSRWGLRLGSLVLAALAAVPNLITLGIVLGGGSSAGDAEVVMDDGAPGFRGASAVGAVLGVVLVVVVWWALLSRRHRRLELNRLKADARRREAEAALADAEAGHRPQDDDHGDLDLGDRVDGSDSGPGDGRGDQRDDSDRGRRPRG